KRPAAAFAGRKTGGAFLRLAGAQGLAPEPDLVRLGLVPGERPLGERRESVVAQAELREGGDLAGEVEGRLQSAALGREPVGKADLERLLGVHRPAGEDQV